MNRLVWDFDPLRDMLFRSMLEKDLIYGDIKIGLRTIFLRERQEYLRRNLSLRENGKIIIALSLTYINDVFIPYEKDVNTIMKLSGKIDTWSSKLFSAVLVECQNLRARSLNQMESVHAFVYIPESKREWESYKISRRLTPFDDLGMNEVQKTWIHFSSFEDDIDRKVMLWENCAMVAGAASHSKKYADSLDRAIKRYKEKRDRDIEETLYERPKPKFGSRSETMADLAEIAIKDLEGVLDEHDIAVRAYERRIDDDLEKRKVKHKEYESDVFEAVNLPWEEDNSEFTDLFRESVGVEKIKELKENEEIWNRVV